MKPPAVLVCLTAFAAASCATAPAGRSLAAAFGAADWANAEGASLARQFDRDGRRSLGGRPIGAALADLRDSGFECATGEGGDDHPDPMSVCQRSFATRACQFDWEVTLAPRDAVVGGVETSFARDCVGIDRDFPAPKRSAIDDQLAPPRMK